MSSNDVAIRVSNLSKRYEIYNTPRDRLKQFILPRLQLMPGLLTRQYFREFWALKDVSFEINRGESVGIIGRNGSGKSTLLQIICGTLSPTEGGVETQGRIAALLELGSGFNLEFTGRENVYMNGTVLGLNKEEIDARFDDIAAFADIGDFISRPVKTYSSGMMVRLAFAVQAIVDPEILIVDEALAVGDEKFQRKCFARLEELKSRGTSILFVSHSGAQIVELCDRAILLDHGERVMYSNPLSVVRSYQRLIYAPEGEHKKLLLEFKKNDAAVDERELPDDPTMSIITAKSCTNIHAEMDDSFDPGLIPETTIFYPEQGARIDKIEIQDIHGRRVNVLRSEERYRIVVSGHFLADFEKVNFGIHIRSISGAEISGQRHPEEGRFIEKPKEGSKFRIGFWFNMNLLPGTYFIGGGIWSPAEPTCLHRILDAIMFRVQSSGPVSSFGYCNLKAAPVDFELR